MSVDPVILTAFYDNVDRNSYPTASIAPTADRWLIVDVVTNRSATAAVPTPSGLLLTYTEEATVTTVISDARRITRLSAWTGASPGSGAITFDLGGVNHNGCAWIIYELGADVDTSAPFVQTVTEFLPSGTALDIDVPLAAFASANNRPLICALHTQNEAATPEAGYTEIADVFGASPSTGFAAAFHPSATDTSPSYSWPTADNEVAAIASEIKAAAVGAPAIPGPPVSAAVI